MLLSSHILIMLALHGTLTSMKNWKRKYILHKISVGFCLKLDKRHHISSKEFESINWLPVYKRVHQCINAIKFEFVNNACSHYLNEVCEYAPQWRIESKSNFTKLKVPFQKTNKGQKGLSYISPSAWNNLPGSTKKPTVFEYF